MKKFSEFFFSKNFENLFVRNGTELSVGINIRPSILDLEEEIAHHVKYQTCHFFRNSKFSIFFINFFRIFMNNLISCSNSRPNHCKPMLGKGGRFYEPIRTINHFGQSDFRVLCHFGFGFFYFDGSAFD